MLRGKKLAERHMQDTLQIGTDSGGGWGKAPTDHTWTYDAVNTVKCHVDKGSPTEVSDGTQTTLADATIYVPLGTELTATNRVKVTHLYRDALATAEIYSIIGAPVSGRASMVLNCKRVTGNAQL